MSWRPEFFGWLRRQLIVVEDWPYAGTYFTGDPDLPLPEGDDWDEELGKIVFLIFMLYDFLLIHVRSDSSYMHMQMSAQIDEPVCLPFHGELILQLTLRRRVPREESWSRTSRGLPGGF